MINRVDQSELEKKIQLFIDHKIPYVMRYSSNGHCVVRTEVEGWGDWQNKEASFPSRDLQFIKSVKEHVVKNKTYRNIKNIFCDRKGVLKEKAGKKIKYFYYNKKIQPGFYMENVFEVDLKNAYWDTNYQMKLVDEDIYKKGLTVAKKSRLAAIGSYAKKTSVIKYDGIEQKQEPDELSIKTAFLWHTISHKVGKIMAKASRVAKANFLFFWVDACFVQAESVEAVKAYFASMGYNCSVIKCEWIQFDEKGINVHSEQKGKWIEKKVQEKVVIDGKNFLRTKTVKEWRTVRPFPYTHTMTEAEIINLNS